MPKTLFRPALALIMTIGVLPMAHATEDRLASCAKGREEVSERAKAFHGEEMIRKLIAADLKRSEMEQAEGDADECAEALEHAQKLMKGDY